MACAPFDNPLENALSYLYTNKAIDEDLNIKAKNIRFYLDRFEQQTGYPLFEVKDSKLVPIKENFDMTGMENVDVPIPVKSIKDINKEQWTNSNLEVPEVFGENVPMLEEMLNNGFFEMRCR